MHSHTHTHMHTHTHTHTHTHITHTHITHTHAWIKHSVFLLYSDELFLKQQLLDIFICISCLDLLWKTVLRFKEWILYWVRINTAYFWLPQHETGLNPAASSTWVLYYFFNTLIYFSFCNAYINFSWDVTHLALFFVNFFLLYLCGLNWWY